MKFLPHSAAEWIMASGIVFSLGLFFVAVFEDNPWEDHSYDDVPPITAGAPAPHVDGKEKMTCSTCHIILPSTVDAKQGDQRMPIPVGSRSPHKDNRNSQPCSNCHVITDKFQTPIVTPQGQKPALGVTAAMQVPQNSPPPAMPLDKESHEVFTSFRFQGKILRLHPKRTATNTNPVSALIDNGITKPRWISLAPYWYLKSEGCMLGRGMFVKGTAMADNPSKTSTLSYSQTVAVNGELCTLRNSHLIGLWEPNATFKFKNGEG